jgi:hypothetical protein
MRMSMRRALAAVALVLATIATSTVVFVSPAAAAPAWDASIPSWWYKRAFFVGHPAPQYLRMDAAWAGGHGSPVHLWPSDNNPAQIWAQEPASEGGSYLHPGYNRWLCLDFDGERGWGVPLKVNNCNGSASQRWHFEETKGLGYTVIRIFTHSDKQFCIDVPNNNIFTAGQTLQIYGCNGTQAQIWLDAACYRSYCQGHDPQRLGCSTNSQVISDFTFNNVRVTLHWGWECQAVWARMAVPSTSLFDRRLELRRLTNGADYRDSFFTDVHIGQTGWTPMYGGGNNYGFRACYNDPVSLAVQCSPTFMT